MTTTDLVHVPRVLPAPRSEKALAVDVAAYMLNKKKRLTEKSQRGYMQYLRVLVNDFPDHTLHMFEPPTGSLLLEDFLNRHWGERAPATYNKAHSVLSDFFSWHVKRMNLMRDPMLVIEKAKRRQYHRTTFSEEECAAILNANPYPRAQIALRLLLFYGIRKGALQNVRFKDFNRARNEITIFTKGETIQRIQLAGDAIWDLLDELARRWLERTIEAASVQVNLTHDEPIGEHSLHLLWYRWLRRAGVVAKGVTSGRRLHSARHTAAQRVLDKTNNIKAAQKLLGHKSAAVTEAYTEYSDDQLGDAMGAVLGGVEASLSQTLQRRVGSQSQGGRSRG